MNFKLLSPDSRESAWNLRTWAGIQLLAQTHAL